MQLVPSSDTDPGLLIAVIDDDEAVRLSLEIVLRRLGRPIRSFVSAEDFFEAAHDGCPALVVVDINLPGMSGWSAIQTLRAQGCHSPVVAISGRQLCSEDARARGAAASFEKPLCPGEFIGVVERFLAPGA